MFAGSTLELARCGKKDSDPGDETQNPIDADSSVNHVGESSVHVTSFASAYSFFNFPGDAAMYYGLYLFAIALVLMMGQLAFALYQVASLFFLSRQPPLDGNVDPCQLAMRAGMTGAHVFHACEAKWSPPPQFFSTIRPTTLPARSSSIHFWTSAIGSSFIGVGLILPARASAISSFASASVPTMKPSTVMRL